MARVVIDNLVKIYADKKGPGVRAVNEISLTVEDGEFMVLVGPSGCGKSTTLRMIAGLEEISSGTISIDDRVINSVLPKDRDIAMVFQNYALYPHMSVFENMAFGLRLRKYPKKEIQERVREAAAILGIEDLLDRRPKALSGGQRQRVAVGRAIVRKPKVFLFDEPLSNLDAKMRVTMRAEIAKLHDRLATTMVYVTHDQVEAMTMGDRICVMKDGNIMQVARPLELYHRPANQFVAGFIGSPPMNFLRGHVERVGDGLAFVEDNANSTPIRLHLTGDLASRAAGYAERPVVFGIRPEDVHACEASAPDEERNCRAIRVEVTETMGYETYHYLNTGAHALVARVRSGSDLPTPNTDLMVRFDADRAQIFDPATEAVIN